MAVIFWILVVSFFENRKYFRCFQVPSSKQWFVRSVSWLTMYSIQFLMRHLCHIYFGFLFDFLSPQLYHLRLSVERSTLTNSVLIEISSLLRYLYNHEKIIHRFLILQFFSIPINFFFQHTPDLTNSFLVIVQRSSVNKSMWKGKRRIILKYRFNFPG